MEFRSNSLSPEVLKNLGIKSSMTLGEKFRVLNRVPNTEFLASEGVGLSTLCFSGLSPVGDEKPFAVLDTETTGFSAENSSIIELGIIKGSYSPSEKRITSLSKSLCMLEDPGHPLPDIITEVTGITDADLKGQSIDDSAVESFLSDVELIIAHNARFDRGFFENRFPSLKRKIWACSSKGGDINWKQSGFKSAALDSLLLEFGYFFDGHRASVDCMATAWLLLVAQDKFAELLEAVEQSRYRLKAIHAPFEVKDILKGRGYKWDADDRVWHTTLVGKDKLDEELTAIDNLYPGGAQVAQVIEESIYLRHCA